MRHEIRDIKFTKNINILLAFLAILGLAFSIYVYIHVAEINGIVTEQRVAINKDTNEAKVIFKVNNKEFIYKDKVTHFVEKEPFNDYTLAKVNFNIGDTIKVNYKDANYDKKPTYDSKNMQFKVTSRAEVPFKDVQEKAMDLVRNYNLVKDSAYLKNLIHPDSKMDLSVSKASDFQDNNEIQLKLINPKFKLIDDTYELSVKEVLFTTTELLQKNKSVYTFKFDHDALKIFSVDTESAIKR